MDFGYFLRRFDYGCHINPNKEAVIFEDETVTYLQMRDRAYKLANALSTLGLKKGERVAVLLRNCTAWFDIYFALSCLGAVLIPVNILFKTREIEYIVNDSGASIMFVGSDLIGLVDLERKNTPNLREVICIGAENPPANTLSYSKFRDDANAELPRVEVHMDDLLLLQYSSGTTGFPKGAMHTHSTKLWINFGQIPDLQINANDRWFCVPALCWVSGFHTCTLATLWMGGTVIINPTGGFDLVPFLETIKKHEITKVPMVPTILKLVVDFPEAAEYLNTVDLVITGSEPVPVSTIKKFNQLFPQVSLIQGYGLSECVCVTYQRKEQAIKMAGSAGKPFTNCELLIVDDSMNKVPPGMNGEIVLRSPGAMIGYWNNSEATEEVFKGGWMHTGDLAKYDEEGYIYITGRKKDMFTSGGLNVYPAEIENIIIGDSRVSETAVVGVPDQKWGEVGCAVIIPKERMKIDQKEVEERCKKNLANYKVPKKYIITDQPLPRTASGKIKKYELRENIQKGLLGG